MPHLLGSSFLKYVLPFPAGLLAGTGYLWGTLTEPQYNDDYTEIKDVVIFRGVSPKRVLRAFRTVYYGSFGIAGANGAAIRRTKIEKIKNFSEKLALTS